MDYSLAVDFAPGDNWAVTGLLRDFAKQRPQDRLYLRTAFPEIFQDNPYFRRYIGEKPDMTFKFGQEGTRYSYGNRDKCETMAGAFHRFLTAQGVAVERDFKAVDYYLSAEEKRFSLVPLDLPVCIVNAGYKNDNPAKWWGQKKFQQIVDVLSGRVRFIQVGAKRHGTDFHCALDGVQDWRGMTTLRDLAQLVYHADFILTGISQLHHISAIPAYKARHCITLAGAREPENWANCYERELVTWHWLCTNEQYKSCMEQDPHFHNAPGCWHGECSACPPPCMESICVEDVLGIFEENL